MRPNKPQHEPIAGALWQRIRQHGIKLGADERLVTELGRLNLFGEFTIAQTAAAQRVGEIYGRYEALKGLHRSARSPSYERSYGEVLLSAAELANLETEIRDATEAFERLVGKAAGYRQHFVPGLIPLALRGTVEDLCVEDRAVSPLCYPDLRRLFDALAGTWGISKKIGPRAPAKVLTATSSEVSAPRPRINHQREAIDLVLRTIRPDLDYDGRRKVLETIDALKDRAAFRAKKPRQEPEENPHVSAVVVHLARARLTLRDKRRR